MIDIVQGITLPEWQFGKLAGHISDREVNGKPINGINGHSSKNGMNGN